MPEKAIIVAAILATGAGASWAQEEEGFRNLQVLPAGIARADLKATMEGFADQLDVKCSFCHVPDQYHLDDKQNKQVARRMLRLVRYMRENAGDYFKDGIAEERIDCWTCHRGKAEPDEFVLE
jgi:Photosynthetic reaction centre cytochrome C subunit